MTSGREEQTRARAALRGAAMLLLELSIFREGGLESRPVTSLEECQHHSKALTSRFVLTALCVSLLFRMS